jgi:orotate phosphoribosyltransferase
LGWWQFLLMDFDESKNLFDSHNIPVATLSNYDVLIEVAKDAQMIQENQVDGLKEWKKDPKSWRQ